MFHILDQFNTIDIMNTFQFKLYEQILSGSDEISFYSTEIKERAVRTVLNHIIDDDRDLEQLNCFSGPNIYKHVTEDFLREFKDYVNWGQAQIYFKFSENFIRYELPIKNWLYISMYQDLNERFIHEFRDRVDWDEVSRHQVMSVPFMKKHHKEVNWEIATMYQESWFKRINNID